MVAEKLRGKTRRTAPEDGILSLVKTPTDVLHIGDSTVVVGALHTAGCELNE